MKCTFDSFLRKTQEFANPDKEQLGYYYALTIQVQITKSNNAGVISAPYAETYNQPRMSLPCANNIAKRLSDTMQNNYRPNRTVLSHYVQFLKLYVMTTDEAAEFLDVGSATFRNYVSTGKLEAETKCKNVPLYSLYDCMMYLKESNPKKLPEWMKEIESIFAGAISGGIFDELPIKVFEQAGE